MNTLQDIIAAYQAYKRAFTMGAYAQGWRLSGRPNRCGNMVATDSPEEFAIRAHNSAAAQVQFDLDLVPEPSLPPGVGPYVKQIPLPEPPRAIHMIESDISKAALKGDDDKLAGFREELADARVAAGIGIDDEDEEEA